MPTEAEWEYVAASAGESSRRYPWGEEDPDKDRANYNKNEGETTEVDGYPLGATPDGVFDMGGNVLEWTLSQGQDYEYRDGDGRNNLQEKSARVVRGGAFGSYTGLLRSAYRNGNHPVNRVDFIGFRVVLFPFSPPELLRIEKM